MSVTVADVAAALAGADRRGADVAIVDVTHDNRQVEPGWLFCAIPGARVDGHNLAAVAVEAGAAALLVERWLELDIPQIKVPSTRGAAGQAAAVVHGNPSNDLVVVGITGTNGKTTTSYLLEGAFAANGYGVGVIGTVETRMHGERQPGVRTTPEGTDLQRLLARMRTRGVDAVAMEVSSHGLDLHRVDGTRFAVGVYTNLSQDHLDWHGSMEAYFAAKARLFTPASTDRGVVWLDGPWAQRLLERAEVPLVTVGTADADDADIRLVDVELDITHSRGRLVGDLGALASHLPTMTQQGVDVAISTVLPGAFNLHNAATAVVAAIAAGVAADVAAAGVAACPGAPGRLERVTTADEAGRVPTVLVDYAHTPDAVESLLTTLRLLLPTGGRLVTVLGCGGDRDAGKRGPMGAAAAEADVAVLTSDNPRSEDPMAILDAMTVGAQAAVAAGARAQVVVEPDRRAAIAAALEAAGPTDAVVIAGKGHETGQEFADRTVPFDDRVVARELLSARTAKERP